ncbi:hypothetical protein F383_20092 [Gossypium arboreum]|uniref:Uncharacterized protein n=1 Tax=Gossypium arboreum TaxID=29729 RepID=A0A0B0N8S9_GOSAR|nr:hypothetical protein F383_33943 [Gossypium arboreum]KHG15109.1 hypothetical protein F383_20092 [Gossypium arboreum]
MDQKWVHDFLLDIRVMPIALLTGFGRRRKPKSNSSSRVPFYYRSLNSRGKILGTDC